MHPGKHDCPFIAARAVCLLAPLLLPNLNFPHALYRVCLFFSFEDGKLIFPWAPTGTQVGVVKEGRKVKVSELVMEGQQWGEDRCI